MDNLTKRQREVARNMQGMVKTAPWVLRITESKKVPGPVLVISERYSEENGKTKLREYGRIYNGDLKACRNAIHYMMSQVCDDLGRPIGVQELIDDKTAFRGNIPLDKTIGTKIALLFKLHPQIRNESRVELLAWRIERFTAEESMYWLGKVSIPTYGKRGIEWAKSGLRLMLAGQSKDQKEIDELLDKVRK